MEQMLQDSQIAVFDHVLPKAHFEAFWEMFRNAELSPVHARRKADYYRMSDGNPFMGENVAWTPVPAEQLLPPGVTVDSLPVRFYPTGTPLDRLLDLLQQEVLPQCAALLGQRGRDWVATVGQLYAYPAGTGMSWHVDDDELDGSFIYYAHPHWDVQWGGELFVADPSTRGQLVREAIHDYGNTQDTRVLLQKGLGRFILPKPNRLVVIGPGNPHRVVNVAAAAGDRVRASFSGFFIAPAGLDKLIAVDQARRAHHNRYNPAPESQP